MVYYGRKDIFFLWDYDAYLVIEKSEIGLCSDFCKGFKLGAVTESWDEECKEYFFFMCILFSCEEDF